MKSLRFLLFSFSIFIGITVLLYLEILLCNQYVPFDTFNYVYNSHHYIADHRIEHKPFTFLNALGQYDAQWYLKIAHDGYPDHPKPQILADKSHMGALSYAFFPFYPFLIHIVDIYLHNIELSAFTLTIILLVCNFFSLYFVVSSLYDKNIALKTIFLLFLFPFSIFFRSYFTEGLFLLEIVWFSYFLIRKSWFMSAVCLALVMVTRGTGLFLIPVFLYVLLQQSYEKNISFIKICVYLLLAFVPFLGWLFYCFIHTGNPFYFLSIRSGWESIPAFIIFFHNIVLLMLTQYLPLHSFHYSQLDNYVIITTFLLLILSWKKINSILWLIAFMLWIGPLLTTDTMSFSRYQIISFPIFLYIASQIKSKTTYVVITTILACCLFITALFFVNWYWLG